MTVMPPRTRSPSATVTFTFAGSKTSVRELNLIMPKRSPRFSRSPVCFQQTIRRARMPAICLHTTVIFSPWIVNAFCSLTTLDFLFVAIKNFPGE